jgi:hypothetical protein
VETLTHTEASSAAVAPVSGTSLIDAAKQHAELFNSALRKQKEAIAKHPMAYMYALSRA